MSLSVKFKRKAEIEKENYCKVKVHEQKQQNFNVLYGNGSHQQCAVLIPFHKSLANNRCKINMYTHKQQLEKKICDEMSGISRTYALTTHTHT